MHRSRTIPFSKWLGAQGRDVVCVREPGGTIVGEALRKIIKDPQYTVEPIAELLLFAASRAQLVREVIRPALEQGVVVLCDRFIDSTVVYQGVARRLPPEIIANLNDLVTGAPDRCMPELTFVIQLSPEERTRRIRLRGGPTCRFENEAEDFRNAVDRGYEELRNQGGERLQFINGDQPPEQITEQLCSTIAARLP